MGTVDLNSNKIVARIEAYIDKKGKVIYRKWFMKEFKDSFGYIKNSPDSVEIGDMGVVITREEFDAIRHAPCSDTRTYRNYTNCYVCQEHELLLLYREGETDSIANRIEWAKENWSYDKWYKFKSQWLPLDAYEEPDVIPEKQKEKVLNSSKTEKERTVMLEEERQKHVKEYNNRRNKNFRKDVYYLETREKIFTLAEREKIKAGCCLYGKIVNRVPFSNKDDAMKFLDKSIPISSVVKNGDILIQEQNVYKETVDENECFISGYVFANCKDYYLDMMDRKSLIMK